MAKIEVNVNDYVKVKLNTCGIKILTEKHNELNKWIREAGGKEQPFTLKIDENGYYKTQLHDLMNVFGSYMVVGNEVPFETNIIFDGKG